MRPWLLPPSGAGASPKLTFRPARNRKWKPSTDASKTTVLKKLVPASLFGPSPRVPCGLDGQDPREARGRDLGAKRRPLEGQAGVLEGLGNELQAAADQHFALRRLFAGGQGVAGRAPKGCRGATQRLQLGHRTGSAAHGRRSLRWDARVVPKGGLRRWTGRLRSIGPRRWRGAEPFGAICFADMDLGTKSLLLQGIVPPDDIRRRIRLTRGMLEKDILGAAAQ